MNASAGKQEVEPRAVQASAKQGVCRSCGQPADEDICPACADKIRAESLMDIVGRAPKARSKPGARRVKARSAAGD